MDKETRKRPPDHKREAEQEEEEPIVDDLVVAAGYALAQPRAANQADNEINVDDCVEDVEFPTTESTERNDAIDKSGRKDEDPESDNASDVDLTEELAQMMDEDGDGEELGSPTSAAIPPRTAHEIDLYQAQAKQLESNLLLKLTIDEQEAARIKNAAAALQPAGTVHHYLESEGTIIVQSAANGVLLQEGTLLVLKSPDLIPLGRILEVFGPVSRPLYSIRLPASLPEEPSTDNTIDQKDYGKLNALPSHAETLAKALAERPTVYYVPDGSSLLDIGYIYKNSGKGCDASNVFDEEVVNPAELDYSDDEEERLATGRARSKKRGNQRSNNVNNSREMQQSNQHMATAPSGFHPTAYCTVGRAASQPNHTVLASSLLLSSTDQVEAGEGEDEGDTVYYDF